MILTDERSKQAFRHQSAIAVKKGIIPKLDYCEHCNATDKKLQMHHDDYSNPYKITWLCSGCHSLVHKGMELIQAPEFVGRELRAVLRAKKRMPQIIKQTLATKGITLKEWCKRRRINYDIVYNLFGGISLGLYGEAKRAKHLLDINFNGWDTDVKYNENYTFDHLNHKTASTTQ